MIRFYTSGVIGTSDLVSHLFDELTREPDVTLQMYDLNALCDQAEQKHWPQYTMCGDPFLILLEPEFEREDLRTTGDQSPQLQRYLKTLTHLAPAMAIGMRQFVFVGREHGLGFVPMITTHREQIRRETKLAEAIVPHASSYKIMFAGQTFLTLFDRS